MKTIGDTKPKREFTAVANGAISKGDPCIIESAGTVAAVAETNVVASTPSFGAEQDLGDSGNYTDAISIGSGKYVIAWRSNDASLPMQAVVATIDSATDTVSYGTVATFDTPSSFGGVVSLAWDSDNSKLGVFYYVNNASCKVRIATISGTTLSFGTAVTYETGFATQPTASYAGSGKFIVCHYDTTNSNYLVGYGVSVSGTTPTVGTKTTLESTTSSLNYENIWNETAGRVVVVYRANSSAVKARVLKITTGTTISAGAASSNVSGSGINNSAGTNVSGTKNILVVSATDAAGNGAGVTVGTIDETAETISFGSRVLFMAYNDGYTNTAYQNVGYNPATGAVIGIARDNNSTGDAAYAALATLDGTTLSSFGSLVVMTDEVTAPRWFNTVYDPTSQRLVSVYEYVNVEQTSVVITDSSLSSNLTAENFIGFASKGVADTADATVSMSGATTKDQTGLTAGQKYYVQNDGSLSETPDSPSVVAGTAISATELIVKG